MIYEGSGNPITDISLYIIANDNIYDDQETYLSNIKPVQFSKSIGVRRPLSGGELFSLLLLITSIFLSLALGVFIALLRGGNFNFTPSWLI